ncbi:PAS domain S-box protein [Candidatus Saccharibacteria bacterium]|nr:PAS domain S-box protein [Candidatus Saccharibacteria bacterium]
MALFGKKNTTKIEPVNGKTMISSNSIKDDAASREAEQALNELVLKSIHEGIAIIGADRNIRLANPALTKLTGVAISDMIGMNYDTIFNLLDKNGDRLEIDKNPIALAFSKPDFTETRDFDLAAADNSNRITPVSLIITPTEEDNPSLVITFRDIAQELKAEQERSDFISTASHEMRTPVASIEGYLALAMNPQTATVDARALSYLEKAHEASRHLGRLFRDLLDTSKLDDGKMMPQFEPVDIVEMVKNIAEGQLPRIKEKGLDYQFGSGTVDRQLGGSRNLSQLIYASVDPDFLREIIDNLIENAIKYTPAGWISVTVRADEHNAQICVEDTGIGIASEELDHIFQKFYRVDSRDTREIGGTGLGLYLVKERVEAMRGRIWVESELGKGSKFIVILPRLSKEKYQQQRFLYDNRVAQATIMGQAGNTASTQSAQQQAQAFAQAAGTTVKTPPQT